MFSVFFKLPLMQETRFNQPARSTKMKPMQKTLAIVMMMLVSGAAMAQGATSNVSVGNLTSGQTGQDNPQEAVIGNASKGGESSVEVGPPTAVKIEDLLQVQAGMPNRCCFLDVGNAAGVKGVKVGGGQVNPTPGTRVGR
jgi:hypothetical protein